MEIFVVLAAIINLAPLIWFIRAINRIEQHTQRQERNTREIADYSRRLALVHPPTKEQTKIINRDLSPSEIVAALRSAGARLSLKRGEHASDGSELLVENERLADPELLRLLFEYRPEVIAVLSQSPERDGA